MYLSICISIFLYLPRLQNNLRRITVGSVVVRHALPLLLRRASALDIYIHIYIYVYIYLYVSISIPAPVSEQPSSHRRWQRGCPARSLPIYLSIYIYISISIYLYIYLSVYLYFYTCPGCRTTFAASPLTAWLSGALSPCCSDAPVTPVVRADAVLISVVSVAD